MVDDNKSKFLAEMGELLNVCGTLLTGSNCPYSVLRSMKLNFLKIHGVGIVEQVD